MKFDGFPGEKTILSYKLANGVGWLTTHRLIIQQEKHNPKYNIIEKRFPEFYFLKLFKKAEIARETLAVHFYGERRAEIRLQTYSHSLLQEVKEYMSEPAKTTKHPT
jgi:hypothetical protein